MNGFGCTLALNAQKFRTSVSFVLLKLLFGIRTGSSANPATGQEQEPVPFFMSLSLNS